MEKNQIWTYLNTYNFLTENIYDNSDETFAIKIYERDFEYIKNNYLNIVNIKIQNECFIIAVAFAENIDILKFMIDKFKIDNNYINHIIRIV